MHHHTTRIAALGRTSCKALALAVAIAVCSPVCVAAAQPDTASEAVVNFDIPAGDLSTALEKFSTQSGIQAMYRQELVAGKLAPAVKGPLAPTAALAQLLSDAGLTSERVNARTYVLKAAPKAKPTRAEPVREPNAETSSHERAANDQVHELEGMVVVGSRLGVSSPVESAMPIKLITREDIDRSGAGSIAQVLSYLSEVSVNNVGDRDIDNTGVADGGNINSSTVQMRGLPRGTTLVLINGRRAGDSAALVTGGQFDLSTIPLALVERVEVLPAGASAVYGGDGLSGVINIVLRRDASGMEMRVRRSYADGYGSSQASLMWGKSWSRGDVTVAANWRENDALFTDERALTANHDYRRFGGDDLRTAYTSPGTIYSVACKGGLPYCALEDREPLPGLNSPVAAVPPGQDGTGLSLTDFVATEGVINKTSTKRHLVSAEKSRGLTLNGRFEIKPEYEVFVELMATRREVPAYQLPLLLQKEPSSNRVPASHPFNPFGVGVGFDYRYNDTGLFTAFSQNHYRGLLGLRGKAGHFDWEVSGWRARDVTRSDGGRGFDQSAITEALASPDPASVLNPFVGNGGAPASRDVLASMLFPLDHDASSDTTGITGFIRGSLIELPQGKVLGLVGLERQKQSIDIDSSNTSLVTRYLHGSSRSHAVFTEVRVPVLGPRHDGTLERVAVTGALRRENSDRFESATRTEVVGLEVRPTDSLLLRATYSTAFKPLVANLAIRDPVARMQAVSDPKFGGDYFTANVTSLGGVPPELKPERSATRTIGAVWRPVSELSLSMTHWDIRFRDRIAGIDPQSILMNEDDYPGRVTRDPTTGIVSEIDSRQINISLMESAGVDFDIEGYWSTAIGDFRPALSATYVYRYREQRTSDSPISERVSIYGSTGWAPRWKIVPRMVWEYRNWASAMLAGRYVSRYENRPMYSTTSASTELGDFWVFDLNLDLNLGRMAKSKFLSGTKLSLGATNIFNRLPDFCVACGISGYDASQYDIVGRTVYAELRVGF